MKKTKPRKAKVVKGPLTIAIHGDGVHIELELASNGAGLATFIEKISSQLTPVESTPEVDTRSPKMAPDIEAMVEHIPEAMLAKIEAAIVERRSRERATATP